MKILDVFKPKKVDNSGYGNHGANTIKKSLIGWMSYSGSPKEDIEDNIELLRERSRDLYMGGAPIATGAIKTIRTNVVGGGLKLKARLDTDVLKLTDDEAEEKERQIEREFALWSESKLCDAEKKNNFYELQQLAILSQLLSGDAFVLLPAIQKHKFPYHISVQLIEGDRVRTPNSKTNDKNIVSGIEFGKYGEPVAYYFCRKHPGAMSSMFGEKYDRIPAYGRKTGLANVIHIMESERPGQTRGVPVLASVIEPL
ncbi:MAG: phage portal protein, partial [Peptoniphilus harei]|nr:phage portal protein [Peptoniphilus harei]